MPPASPTWHLFIPKLFTVLRQGYRLADLRDDTISGLTVAIVALPLAMALAIASGTTPEKGLITAVVAGLLISALGGSRFQIGGPTGAFVVVVFNVIERYGYDGLILATLMASVMLVAAGLARLGTWIKYIPEPVVTGFTAGIAVIIFSSQIGDLFGLSLEDVPGEFIAKWKAFWAARDTVSLAAVGVAGLSIAGIVAMRKLAPKLPAFLIVVVIASAVVTLFDVPIDTIGSRFGGIPTTLPMPVLPEMSIARMAELLPSAFTIAFLAGIESLLSAVVADGMTGRRHRSNCELVAQGIANGASALFGGMPATGAIARTATNIRAGARSPVSGMLHALFVLAFMVVLGPLAFYIPLASLAAILVIVAWNMSEIERIRYLMLAPLGDRLVLIATFGLTVFVDLTIAIQIGVVAAAILFMHRMAETIEIQRGIQLVEPDTDDLVTTSGPYEQREAIPADVEVFQLRGPLFFGTASRLVDVFETITRPPRVFILRMREVPFVDVTGVSALETFIRRCRDRGTTVIVTGVRPQPRRILEQMGFGRDPNGLQLADDFEAALKAARG